MVASDLGSTGRSPDAALAEVVEYGAGTPGEVLERAVVALRESAHATWTTTDGEE